MSTEVILDLTQAGLDLDPEALEAYTLRLAEELKDGFVEDARLLRQDESPEGAMAGEAGFDLGFLKAEVNLPNLKKLLDWLGERIYGSTLEFEYEKDGMKVKVKYRNDQQLEKQIDAIEKLEKLNIKIIRQG